MSSIVRVVVSGSGRMGRQVAAALREAPDTEALAFVDALSPEASCDGLPVYTDAAACLSEKRPDVVVDFTNAAWTPELARVAIENRARLVIGTTGLQPEFVEWLRATCDEQRIGAVLASNFAIGAVLMMAFAEQAARFMDHAEIIELHHDQKVDAPSGTALTTAERMRAAREQPFVYPDTEKETLPGTRGGEYGGIAIHSVRLPGLVAHQEVIFGGLGQTLSIRHDSTGRESFMPGVLLAVRSVMNEERLIVGLDGLLGLPG